MERDEEIKEVASGVEMEELQKPQEDNPNQNSPVPESTNKNLQDPENTDVNIEEEVSYYREIRDLLQYVNPVSYQWDIPLKKLCEDIEDYKPTESCENFTKGCHWSPDGTCLLVSSEDFRIRIYELPDEVYSKKIFSNLESTNITAILNIKEGGLIYDTCWHPYMNSREPETCCFLSSSRDAPIHLWDAFNGELRATYNGHRQVDAIEAALSMQFINSAKEIWGGFKDALRVFNVERQGRQIYTIELNAAFPNMLGLVSCIRENPVMPGLVAFGTYSKHIGFYKNGPLCKLETGSGVTQIEFSPCGTKLFSAVRRSNEFLCWDLRNTGTTLYSFQGRQANTSQRIHFIVTRDGNQLISGGTDGNLAIWDLSKSASDTNLNLAHKIKLSSDCINGVSLHDSLSILATSTGQRLFGNDTKLRDNSVRLWTPTS